MPNNNPVNTLSDDLNPILLEAYAALSLSMEEVIMCY